MAQYIGQYEILKDLGTGRFGTVYQAVGDVPGKGAERPTRKLVAIKKLREVADRERSLATLRQRVAQLELVSEPRITPVYEILPDEPAVVMAYVHGVTLQRALEALRRSREQFFTEAAVEVGCELVEALNRAYTTVGKNGEPLGLVHQALRPAHVMLTAQGEVRILDFGFSHLAPMDARANELREDMQYLAPEQARRQDVDLGTDLFAVGLILFELLMNQPAYRGFEGPDAAGELMRAVSQGDLREPCRALEQTLPALGPVVTRLLQPRPEDRYRSGAEVLADLRRQLYRERGAYLREFCEFYFGTIQPLGALPEVEENGRGRRKSIAERLKESQARESAPPAAPPPRVVSPPRSPEPPAAPQRPASPPRPPAAPERPAVAGSPDSEGGTMSNTPGGKKSPPRPPVGGPASRATPGGVLGADAGRPNIESRPSKTGERRPDEPGMLDMVPLSNDKTRQEAEADPSATAFFAIPAPKADRAKPAPPPPPPAGPMGVSPSYAPGPPGPPMARPPIGGPMAGAPQPMVQGPVVGYGNAGGASPFQVAGPTPMAPPTAEAGQRVQSSRVYAILVGVFLLVGIAVVAAVYLIPKKTEPVATPPPVVTTPQPVVATKPEVKEDTGVAPAPTPAPKPKAKSTTPKPAPAPSNGPGTLSVTLADAGAATAIEVVCPSGFRQRSALSGGRGSIASVPAESCTMYFKGGAPAQYKPVRGGASYNCSIVGTTAICK